MKILAMIICFFIGVGLTLLGAWLGGFNFDHRGTGTLMIFVDCLLLGGATALIPIAWSDFE